MNESSELKNIAKIIHETAYKEITRNKTTIFLCGASKTNKDSKRDIFKHKLDQVNFLSFDEYSVFVFRLLYTYEIYYPEDLFSDLLHGHSHQDLISLENELADSVDVVILIVESVGTFAELGAFISNDKLRKKLICIIDDKHKRDRSFINYGPLRLMRDRKEGKIIYCNFNNLEKTIDTKLAEIHKSIAHIKKNSTSKNINVTNIVQAHHFVLPCIYLFEPVSAETLGLLFGMVSSITKQKVDALLASSLSILRRNNQICYTIDGIELTSRGMSYFSPPKRSERAKYFYRLYEFDKLRISILNQKYRNKLLYAAR